MDSQNVMSNVSRAVHVQAPCNPFTPIEGVMELRGIDISFTPQSKRTTHSTNCPSASAMAATGDDGKNQFRPGPMKTSGIAYRPEALSQSHLRQSHRRSPRMLCAHYGCLTIRSGCPFADSTPRLQSGWNCAPPLQSMPARGAVAVGAPSRLSAGSQRPTGCRQEALAQSGFGLTVSGFAGLMPVEFNDTSNNCSEVRSTQCDLKLLITFGLYRCFSGRFIAFI